MTSKLSPSLLAVVAIVLLQSCATQSLVKLQPKDKGEVWQSGQEMAVDSAYGVIYEIGFDRIENGCYLFDFNIINRSNMPLLIDPTQFTAMPLNARMDSLAELAVPAVNPEARIGALEQGISNNRKVSRNRVGMVLMGIGASVLANVLLSSDDNPRNDNLRYPITDAIMTTALASGDMADFQAQNLSEQKVAWENSTIRKTTLKSNDSMSGKVFFPYNKKVSYLKITIPIDDTSLEFTFMQIHFPPN